LGSQDRDSKRTGVVHIVFNCIGTVVFMIILSVMQHFNVFGEAFWTMKVDSNIIAIFQTVFNLFTAILLIPFTNQLVNMSVMLVKDVPVKIHNHPELYTLSENLYISPALAVVEATKAVASMGHIAKDNFRRCCDVLLEYDESNFQLIDTDEDNLDRFADRSDRFLIGLSKVVETTGDDNQVDMLLQVVPGFERVGDYGTNMVELAKRLRGENVSFSDNAKKELSLLCSAVHEILDITVDAFESNDNQKARLIEPLEETIDDMVMILRDRHTKRLKNGACSISSGLVFMEALTQLERASDHCSSIGVMMLAREDEAILHNHHKYLHELHSGGDSGYRAENNRRRVQYIEPLLQIQ
jgi:phosphate:Na+ symporter